MSSYKVRARSVIHPGNFLVEHANGSCYVYFADVGQLSATAIEPSLAEAMVQSYEWTCDTDDQWHTLAELHSRTSTRVSSSGSTPDHPPADW